MSNPQESWAAKPGVHGAELKLLKAVIDVCDQRRKRREGEALFVHAQVAIRQFLHAPSDVAGRSINGWTIDVLVVDRIGSPRLAFEMHGKDHWGDDRLGVEERDRLKRRIMREADIVFSICDGSTRSIATATSKAFAEFDCKRSRDVSNRALTQPSAAS